MLRYKKHLLLTFVLLFSITVFLAIINADLNNVENLRKTLTGLGKFSFIAFILLCAIRTFILLPCGLFSALGGILFGPVKGTIITLIGFTINALIIYYMANYLGREWVKRLLKDKFNYLDEYINKNSFSSFLFLRIVPLLPFDSVSCIAGISRVKLGNFLAATALGSIPGVFIYTYFGDSLKTLSLEKIIVPGIIIILMTFVPLLYKLIKHRNSIKKVIYKDNKTTI